MRLRKLLLLNLLILASLFVACEKDDDNEDEAAPTPTETQYLYQVERVEIFEKGSYCGDVNFRLKRSSNGELLVSKTFNTSLVGAMVSPEFNEVLDIDVTNNGSQGTGWVSFTTSKHPKDHMTDEFSFRILLNRASSNPDKFAAYL